MCQKVDIVALQETWLLPFDIPYLAKIHQDFEYTGKSAVNISEGILKGRPYGGVAILWRKGTFESVTVINCANVRLAAIKVSLGDRYFLVFCVYMPTDVSDNLTEFTDCLSEVSAIVESCDVEAVYVLGDFNAHPGESFGLELLKFCSEQNWICADIEKLGVESDNYTFVSDAHGCRRWLDHCIVTQAAWHTITNIRIFYDVFWSDHCPFVVECRLDTIKTKLEVATKSCNKVIWGERVSDRIEVYYDMCNSKLISLKVPEELSICYNSHCNNTHHRLMLDEMYNNIVTILSEAAIQSYDDNRSYKHSGRIVGWNRHVREAHAMARFKYRLWLWHNKPTSGPIYDDMCITRKIFKSKLKWCQNHQEQIQLDIIASHRKANNFKKFWKATNKLDIKPTLPVCVGGVNEPISIANMFAEHFKIESLLGPSQPVPGDESYRGSHDCIRFTPEQVATAIKNMTRGKSPGHDSLSIEHLQHAGPHLPRLLATFFSSCLCHSYLPHDLMRTIVVPIIKNKTGDVGDKCNYRPISLATIMAKILDSLLDTQLESYIELHDAQFGFRSELSTENAILALKHTVEYYTKRRTPVYACFLDLSRAFDLVNYDLLWDKLRQKKIPAELLKIFQYWYNNQYNNVRWADKFSERYRLQCGVRQGGITSPKLFNLYINDLIVELSSKIVGCRIDDVSFNNISYADDMVLLSPTVKATRELLKICEKYALNHGLRYNCNKSEFMVFRAVGCKSPENVPAIKLNGIELKRVAKFKYLGHFVTDDLNDNVDIERERRALAVRCNMLARRFARCSEQVKITLFKAYCQVFYTCSLWSNYSQRTVDTLRVQYNNGFRILLGLPRFCSASGMFAKARTDDYYALIRKKTASLLGRVRASSNSIMKIIAERYDSFLLKQYYRLCLVNKALVFKN
ncbi:unnamed protein product [Parnassius mnemosyne]|uniref:Reverse transcriptase domain-containing protein n=1 Tax=Parnassius mnemosyne TaxID=213953 RepID=A0AAV1KKZ3_9NEOP